MPEQTVPPDDDPAYAGLLEAHAAATIKAKVELTPLTVDAKRMAGLLGQSLRTIRTWDAAGKLPQPLRIGGRVVWRLEEIRAWIDAGAPLRAEWNARKASRLK